MREPERGRRFDEFCQMRLKGLSDVEYRGYDLLHRRSQYRMNWTIQAIVRYAGLEYPKEGMTDYEVMSKLQRRFTEWGYGIVTHDAIERILREFYIYHRIKYKGWTWTVRDPDESRSLFYEHEKSLLELRGL